MQLYLDGETRIRLRSGGEGLEIEAVDPRTHFSPLHMLAASLALCTFSVLAGWALQARLPILDLEIVLDWEYMADPYRVGHYAMEVRWPGLPEERRAAALRVASHCTVEHTLTHPTPIETRLAA